MLLFQIRKAFFDTWDNFLPIVVYNIGFVALLAIPTALPSLVAPLGTAFQFAVVVAGALILFVYLGGVFGVARAVTDHRSPSFQVFRTALRAHGPAALAFGGLFLLHIALLGVAVPFYGAVASWFGLFALAMLFWISVTWWLAFQFLLPLRTRLGDTVLACLRKSLLVMFDNLFFTIFQALGALVIALITVATAFLVFGPGGLAVWYHTGLKLRLLKYDYLESHPDADRRTIPWDALLVEERERVGRRTLRGFIFPWKE